MEPRRTLSRGDYRPLSETWDVRHEWVNGEAHAMAQHPTRTKYINEQREGAQELSPPVGGTQVIGTNSADVIPSGKPGIVFA